MADIGLWISLVEYVIVLVIEGMAIQPLKAKQKRGWDLLLLAALINLVFSFASGVITGQILSAIIGAVLTVAISGFLLYEVHGEFVPHKATPKKA